MQLSLVISTDAVGDALLETIARERADIAPVAQDTRCFTFSTQQWLQTQGTLQESLGFLARKILEGLNNQQFEQVDILFCMGLSDSAGVTTVVEAYKLLEYFLNLLTTRRLLVALPRELPELHQVADNLEALLGKLASLPHGTRELQLCFMSQSLTTGGSPTELAAYTVIDRVPVCRQALDRVLANCQGPATPKDSGASNTSRPPTHSAAYAALIFERKAWQNYWHLRSSMDLTKWEPITADAELDRLALECLARHKLITDCFRGFAGGSAIRSLALSSAFSEEQAKQPLERAVEQLALSLRALFEKHVTSTTLRMNEIRPAYGAQLTGILDQFPHSLEGFRRALYFHKKVLGLESDPLAMAEEFARCFGKEIIAALDQLVRCANLFCSGLGLVPCEPEMPASILQVKIQQMQSALEKTTWPEDWSPVQSWLLDCLHVIHSTLFDAQTQSESYAQLLENLRAAAQAGDRLLCAERQNLETRVKNVHEAHPAPQSAWGRFKHNFGGKKALQKALAEESNKSQESYGHWGTLANVLIGTASAWLHLVGKIDAVRAALQIETRELAEEGQFLLAAEKRLQVCFSLAATAWHAIPEQLTAGRGEVSFLGKTEMEILYQKFGPAQVEQFLPWLRNARPDAADWPSLLAIYVSSIETYTQLTCAAVVLDLPLLMLLHFPDLVSPRIDKVITTAKPKLIPLTPEHLPERRFQMCWGFPEDQLAQARIWCADHIYRDIAVSVLPTTVDYYPNFSRDRLDLALSVGGFRLEDYLYWDVFKQPPSQNSPPTPNVP